MKAIFICEVDLALTSKIIPVYFNCDNLPAATYILVNLMEVHTSLRFSGLNHRLVHRHSIFRNFY